MKSRAKWSYETQKSNFDFLKLMVKLPNMKVEDNALPFSKCPRSFKLMAWSSSYEFLNMSQNGKFLGQCFDFMQL